MPGPDGVLRGREETPEERAARQKRYADAAAANKIRREQERQQRDREQERRTQVVEDRSEQQRRRQEALAMEARAKDDARRARLGLPPRQDQFAGEAPVQTGAPQAPGQAPQAPGRPAGGAPTQPTGQRPPRAPQAANEPMTLPTVNDIGAAPPMRPVRTVNGDFRRQSINGSDIGVPLVELTANGYPAYVPNAGALSADEFASTMTQRDATAIGDMVRSSGDRQAMEQQRGIDLKLQQIARDQTLTPQERQAAMEQARRQQSDLHYGFLQSQGVGQGVRAGFGDVNPQAPMMAQVQDLAMKLMQQYPEHAAQVGPEAFYEAARSMLEEGSQAARPGTTPMSAQLLGEMQRGQLSAQEARVAQQQDTQLAQRFMQEGMEPRMAYEMAQAQRTGDVERVQGIAEQFAASRAYDEYQMMTAAPNQAEVEAFISREVLGRDSAYNRKAQRLQMLNSAFAGDKKAQDDLSLYPGSPEWDAAFGQEGELEKLDLEVRQTLARSLADPQNIEKAQRGVVEGRKGYMRFDPATRRGRLVLRGAFDALPDAADIRRQIDANGIGATTEMLAPSMSFLSEPEMKAMTLLRATSDGGQLVKTGLTDEEWSALRKLGPAIRPDVVLRGS